MNRYEKKFSARFTFGRQRNKSNFIYYLREQFGELATVVILRITYINKVKLRGMTIQSLYRKSHVRF